nr:unnamed protein product [Haemonchus contortus]
MARARISTDMTLPIKLELVLRLRSVVERIEIIAHDLYIRECILLCWQFLDWESLQRHTVKEAVAQQVAIATLDDELKGAEKKLG